MKTKIIQTEKPARVKLSKLTFRQYLALSLIFSKYTLEKKYPTSKELKETIEFDTDRMLEITLNALDEKGFLTYHGNLNYQLKNGLLKHSSLFVDPLMLVKNYSNLKKIKKKIKTKQRIEFGIETPSKTNLFSKSRNTDYLKLLNNETRIFHRWYGYLADFPPSLVLSELKKYEIKKGSVVFDPFCGSGTTLVTSKLFNIKSIGIDVNPIPAFVSKVKTEWNINLKDFNKYATKILSQFKTIIPSLTKVRLENDLVNTMGFLEFHQWLKPKTQNEVILMKELIESVKDNSIKDLFNLALIESATESSNVSFCPGTSFYPFRKKPTFYHSFLYKLKIMSQDISLGKEIEKFANCDVFNDDCRKASKFIKPSSVDFLFTSPPYPNDMEYTRQTRLDLYLLNYVKSLNDVKEIKKRMVKGSTKLIFKESNSSQYVENNSQVQSIANEIAERLKGKNWGWDYPRMVREYFGDMYLCLKEFKKILKPGAPALFIVGDQTSKNVLIPVGKILLDMAKELKFRKGKIELFRVRRSTLHEIPLNEEILALRG